MSALLVEGGGPAVVQDGGRPGLAHLGVPAGGFWLPPWAEAANAAVGNAAGVAGLECYGPLRVRLTGAPRRLSVDGAPAQMLQPDESFVLPAPRRRCAFLALEGGLDVPVVLGGRGLLLVAGLGGGAGRPLRRGDLLPLGALHGLAGRALEAPPEDDGPLPLLPGPDLAELPAGTFEQLCALPFTLDPRGDRTGLPLAGPRLPRAEGDAARSRPMLPGAIQLPAGGEPIVLGPDAPVTGGYPIAAILPRDALHRLCARRPGARVQFLRSFPDPP